MHRSSESIAAIATALAKAQIELSNPEKAMVGTVYNNRSDSSAKLPLRLPVERPGHRQKSPGRPPDRDRADHRHRSGQRHGQPDHRPAAHLRGVDLLGLAGLPDIRDIRTPPDGGGVDLRPALRTVHDGGDRRRRRPRRAARRHQRPPAGHKAADTGLAPNLNPVPAPVRSSQSQTGNGTNPPVREKLSAEESAAIRAQLIQEIETLPEDDLQPRAIAILKAKNRLSADDAKLVEDAFAARMAATGAHCRRL